MDLRKLTENGEQFLGRQKSSGSEGGDAQQWCWVPCWVRRFSYSLSSWNFPGSVDGFPPATVGRQPSRSGLWHHISAKGGAAQEVVTRATPWTFTCPLQGQGIATQEAALRKISFETKA